MRLSLKRIVAGVLAAGAMIFALPASPAYAINRVNCSNRTDLLKVHYAVGQNVGTSQCWANSGAVAVNLTVHRVESGNNKATINYEQGGRYYSITLEKWTSTNLPSVRAYELRIW